MCSEIASSREHVPPMCLFPEEKDIKTSMFRKNLITVPSCTLHNSKKSKDDEFLMACVAGIVGNNFLGYFHTHTKIKRTFLKKGKAFLKVIMTEVYHGDFKNEIGKIFPVLVGRPHFNRLESCFRHIAYGLYHHKFGKQFEGECQVLMDFITYDDVKTEKFKILIRKALKYEKQPIIEGENPEVFNYEFYEPDAFGLNALRMTFYQGAKVYVAFKDKEIKEAFNLPLELINAGIKTTIYFQDGSDVEFN